MVFKILSSQKYSMLFAFCAFLIIFFSLDGTQHFNLTKPGLDWFDFAYLNTYRYQNLTYLRITEALLGLISIYFVR